MRADGFTAVHVTTDPAEGAMLVELLREEAIDARLEYVNAPLLGAAPHLFPIQVQVPDELAAQARELLSDLANLAATEEPEAAETEESPGAQTGRDARRPLLGAGIALLVPGAGHFYARRPWTAIVLELGILACLDVLSMDLCGTVAANWIYASLFAIPLCDSVGGFFAARAFNRGVVASRAAQLGRGGLLLLVAGAAGGAAAAIAEVPHWLRARQLAGLDVRCEPGAIRIENRTPTERLVTIQSIGLEGPAFMADEVYALEIDGPTRVRVAAGARGSFAFTVPARVLEPCRGRGVADPRDGACRVRFRLAIEPPEQTDAVPIDVHGTCSPVGRAAAADTGAELEAVPPP